MALSVADIAKKALDGVASKLSGVVLSGNHFPTDTSPTYNPVTGAVVSDFIPPTACRIIDESGNLGVIAKASFPTYVVTGAEKVFFVEGLTGKPKTDSIIQLDNDTHEYRIKAVQDIVGAGTTFRVIVL